MFLNVNLATGIIPAGSDISQIGAGAYQAEYMARNLWSGFWMLALLNGFWVLFSTHLGNTDILMRSVTDIIWAANPKARRWRGGKRQRDLLHGSGGVHGVGSLCDQLGDGDGIVQGVR